MIKPDEMAALLALAEAPPYSGGLAMQVLGANGTPAMRQHRLAEKWERKFGTATHVGWDCGVSVRSGWLTPEGHAMLLAYLRRLGHLPPASTASPRS